MAADIEPLGIPAEARGVAVDPGNAAAHLLGHHHQIAVGLQHIVEIEHHVVGAGIDEHLGRVGVVRGEPGAPRAAMHEHVDGSIRGLGGEDVEGLHRSRAVGEALGRAEALANDLAVADAALEDVIAIGRIDELIVGVVELLLVHVEPDSWTLGARLLRQRGATRRSSGRAGRQHGGPSGIVVVLHDHAAFVPAVELSTMTGVSNQVIVGCAP